MERNPLAPLQTRWNHDSDRLEVFLDREDALLDEEDRFSRSWTQASLEQHIISYDRMGHMGHA